MRSRRDVTATWLSKGESGQNMCWETAKWLYKQQQSVRLIHPKSARGTEPYLAAKDRGETHGPPVAICTAAVNCDVENTSWHYYGVYWWPRLVPLPAFALDDMLLA